MNKLFVQVERVEDLIGRADNYFTPPENKERKPATNYDKLIRKTPEEMAAWLADHPLVSEYDENNPQHKAWIDWLREEAVSDG